MNFALYFFQNYLPTFFSFYFLVFFFLILSLAYSYGFFYATERLRKDVA